MARIISPKHVLVSRQNGIFTLRFHGSDEEILLGEDMAMALCTMVQHLKRENITTSIPKEVC